MARIDFCEGQAVLADRDAPNCFPCTSRIRLKSMQTKQSKGEEAAIEPRAMGTGNLLIPFNTKVPLPPVKQFREQFIEQVERTYLEHLMPHHDYDLEQVSQQAGLSKSRLYALLKKYNINRR